MALEKWLLTIFFSSLMYGMLSPIVYARRLQFLSAASSHTALLAVLISIPLSKFLPDYLVSISIGLALMYAVGYAISKGVGPDNATSILVAFTASAIVITMFYVVTNYDVSTDIDALIMGDPLLVTWRDVIVLSVVSTFVVSAIVLTYREQFHIGFDRDCATLAGINVKIYDAIFYTILAISTIAIIKIVGFVLQHVLILLPCAIAMRFAKGMKSLILYSTLISVFSAVVGLILALNLNIAPSGMIGLITFTFYILKMKR